MPHVNTLIAAVWPEWLKQRVQGYRQVTDATLLAPAPTVILDRILLGQRLTPSLIFGLALTVFGVVLLSV